MDVSRAKKKSKKKAAKAKKTSTRKTGTSNLARPVKISRELAEFLEMEWSPTLAVPRTEVVKAINGYVKEKKLQDTNDKRKIHW